MRRRRLVLAIATATLATAVPATAQLAPTQARGAAEEPIPVTDPVLLESLGFEPDATNVYAMPQALREMAMDPAERATAQDVLLEESRTAHESSPVGGPYGTGTVGYSPVPAEVIRPVSSETQHFHNEGRVCISGPAWFEAHFDTLPHGARLEQVHIWYLDRVDGHDIHTRLYRVCHPDFEAGEAIYTLLGSHDSDGSAGFGFGVIGTGPDGLDETIDLRSCAYVAWVGLRNSAPCDPSDDSLDLGIGRLRAQWRRQISPAPATATFNDVPTSHPFFQHIEALAASGITGGCSANSFCPNSPLTRGQMAVFLATALGLHWGEIEP